MDKKPMIQLIKEMSNYYAGDPKRIQHFVKVHCFAKVIGELQNLDPDTQFILETSAIVHDIGIKAAETKYGTCTGKQQELEGPPLAEEFLVRLGFSGPVIRRVCYLVGHHHTYHDVQGMDHRILLEADFLVNLFEENRSDESIRNVYDTIFRTKAGRELCQTMYLSSFL